MHWRNSSKLVTVLKLDWPAAVFTLLFILHVSWTTTIIWLFIIAMFGYAAFKGWSLGGLVRRYMYTLGPKQLKSMSKNSKFWVRKRVILGPRSE